MNAYIRAAAALVALAAMCPAEAGPLKVEVSNPSAVDRCYEMAELDLSAVTGKVGGEFSVVNDSGMVVQHQCTADGKLIFPVCVKAGEKRTYKVKKGAAAVDFGAPKVYGRLFAERKDDMAWENDKAAYRAYGPALQRSGEQAYGYDIWTKSVDTLVLEQRYRDSRVKKLSFHKDHGNGMDAYTVGPTLGGGTSALLDASGEIVYPYCFADYRILDNGPLRFSVELTYHPSAVDGDSAVVERRTVSLDRGSHLNRSAVTYSGLTRPHEAVAGIVVHRQAPDAYIVDQTHGIMAYCDPTDMKQPNPGIIFVGIVAPGATTTRYTPLDPVRGDATGHLLASQTYTAGGEFVYYWGSAWSKSGNMPDFAAWQSYLSDFAARLASPLKIKIK